MLRHSRQWLQRGAKGLYFPINHRNIDMRVDPTANEEVDIQSRYRRHLRTDFITGETRQTEVPEWSRRTPPTHFISLPLPVKNVLTSRVQQMREAMIFTNKNVESVLIPTAKLHVTLAVLTVPSGAETEKVPLIADIIKDASEKICKEPLKLRFRGLGTFSNGRVLFARCVAEEHFTTLDQLVRRVRRDIGQQLNVDVKGNPHDSYIPHITVAKIRPSQKEAFGSRLPLSMWADFQHQDFGDVTFDEIQLCNMKGKGKNDYYKVESSVKIQ